MHHTQEENGGELSQFSPVFFLLPLLFFNTARYGFLTIFHHRNMKYSILAVPQNSKNLYAGVSRASAIRSSVVKEIGLYIPAASIWPM